MPHLSLEVRRSVRGSHCRLDLGETLRADAVCDCRPNRCFNAWRQENGEPVVTLSDLEFPECDAWVPEE